MATTTQAPVQGRRLNTQEAAEYLGLTASTLMKYRVYGSGPVYQKLGAKCVRYTVQALEDWTAGSDSTSTSDPATAGRASAKARSNPRVSKVSPEGAGAAA